MAKLKKDVHMNVYPSEKSGHLIHLWCSHPERQISEIASIEGITRVCFDNPFIEIYADPRYDANEIAAEIEELLTAEVPEVFRDS